MMYLVSLHVFSLWLCERRRAALAIYTLLLAYILTMWFSPSRAFPVSASRLWWMPHSVCVCILECARVPGLLRLALFLWFGCWGYARNGILSKTVVCFAMLAGLEPAPSEACVSFPMPSPQSAGGSCLPASASCVGPVRRPRGVIAPASARWSVGCRRSVWSRRLGCAVACAPAHSRDG